MVDFALLQTIFGWMFICGLVGVVIGIIFVTIFAVMSQTKNSSCVITGAIGTFVFAFVAIISKVALWIGGLGWLGVWIYTTVAI